MLYSISRNRSVLTRKFVTRWNPLFGQGSSFLPDQVDNLSRWYDADTIATLWQDSGKTTQVSANNDPLGAWEGRGGYGPDLLQATTTNKPTYKTNVQNGKPGIYFITDDFLSASIGWQPCIILALKSYVSNNILGDGALSNRAVRKNTATAVRWIANAIDTTPHDPAGTRIWALYQTGTDKIVRFDGAQVGSLASTNTITWDYVGKDVGGTFLEGYILEMIMYSATPDVSDIVLVENYLNAKWSIY
jgi:hypothetical protein